MGQLATKIKLTGILCFMLLFGFASQGMGQVTLAQDEASNYTGDPNGQNEGFGFEAWNITANAGTGFAGIFLGNPDDAEITNMDDPSFGLFANPEGSGAFVNADRAFENSLPVGATLSVDWGINWDSEDGNKGINLYAGGVGGDQIMNINNGNSSTITINGSTMFSEYGTEVMTLNFEMQDETTLRVHATGRNGVETFDDTFTVSGAPDSFRFYASGMAAGDNRQPYFTNFVIQSSNASVNLTGNAGFRMLSAPAATTFSNLLAPIWTQGGSGANYPMGDPNVFTWDNTSTDIEDTNWTGQTNLNQNITPGIGFLVYVFDKDDNDDPSSNVWPKTLSISGTEFTEESPTVNSNDGGFTLLGNPFATTIEWSLVGSNDLTGTIYVWDPGLNDWRTYADGFGEHDGNIAPFQGFFVQTVESPTDPSVTFTDAAKSTGGTFYGKQNVQERMIVRLELNGEELQSSTWMRFSENGSLDKQVRGDALKLQPLSNNFAQLATYKLDETLYDISHLPLTDEAFNIPLHVSSSTNGTFTLRATDMELPEGFELTFNDHATGESIPVTQDFEYQIQLGAAKANAVPPLKRLTQEPMVAKASPESAGYSFTAKSALGTNIEDPYGQLPEQVTLNQNYPNPFNPSTTISYQLPENSHVTLQVIDMLGRQVATLVDGQVSAGTHQARFDAGNLSSGMYIYRLQAGNTVITKKLTLIK